jgi:SagB-type dehydrogenase family enzyme
VIPAASLRSAVYGSGDLDLYDVAELYHEASKLYPALAERQTEGIVRLLRSDSLQQAAARPVKRNPQLPVTALPPPAPPEMSLWSALKTRRSSRDFPALPLRLATLATLLHAGYGATAPGRRAVPSGGALYPLELYVAASRVDGLAPSLLHFDPEAHALETLREGDVTAELGAASAAPGVLDGSAAAVLVSAVFWRSRFKYGLRGYRFALLEAGHLVQNIALAATALDVAALPLGGFYDDRLDELLGLDGVDESVVYAVVLGGDAR